MKLHCFRDDDEYQAYVEHTDDLDVETAFDMMTEDLRHRGRFSGPAPSRGDLAVMMIHEYLRWPTPEEVARCWGDRPDSVFAKALAGAAPKRISISSPSAKL